MAARFPDPERASAALHSLHRELDDEMKAEIAPLATAEGASTDTLLAGHFREEQRAEVAQIVEQAGGEIVADVDERWTRPRFPPDSSTEPGYSELGAEALSGVGSSGFSDEGGRGFSH
jgi:hypothetical protein